MKNGWKEDVLELSGLFRKEDGLRCAGSEWKGRETWDTQRLQWRSWCVTCVLTDVKRGKKNDSTSILGSRYHQWWSKVDTASDFFLMQLKHKVILAKEYSHGGPHSRECVEKNPLLLHGSSLHLYTYATTILTTLLAPCVCVCVCVCVLIPQQTILSDISECPVFQCSPDTNQS